eukprot:CAMPEP_0118932730 /NCGR_PEP_ID=MMETSP1169-20130426/10588_1 /TAXON_ID=36882 /ORGANISM="Pyramimonas obovata, Strain CCMP722" /LENGTH=622 /DNA_ID=CAMNT_0006875427 /DNA_START=519 /DNA_END=2384 /DNA_ORIENTATION=-
MAMATASTGAFRTMMAARARTPGQRVRGGSGLLQKTPHTRLNVYRPQKTTTPRWRCRDAVGPSELSEIAAENVAWTAEEAEPVNHTLTATIQEIEVPNDLIIAEEKAVPYGPAPLDISPSVTSKFKVHRAGKSGAYAWVTSPVVRRTEKVVARANPLPWWKVSKSDKEMLVQVGTCAAAAILDPLLGMVDTICIGQLGVLHLAAMAPNNTVFGMVNQLATFTVVVAVANKVASALGAGKSAEAKGIMSASRAFNVGMTSSLLISGAVMALFLGAPDFFLNNFGAFPETLALAKEYFWVRALGLPAMLVSMVLQGSYSAVLDLKTPLVAIIVSGVMNAVLDVLFIFQFGWGLFGASLATVMSQYIGGGMLFYKALTSDRHKFHLAPLEETGRHWALSLEPRQPLAAYKEFLGMCLVQSTRAMNVILTWTMCNVMASRLGTVQAASHQLLFQFQMFLISAVQSFTTVGNSVTARAYYAGGMRAAKNLANRLSHFSTLFAVTISGGTWAMRDLLPRLFTSDAAVCACATSAMVPVCLMLLLSWFKVPEGALLGVGDGQYLALSYVPATMFAMLQLVNSSFNSLGLEGVWYALCLYYFVLMVCFCVRWYKREWTEIPGQYLARARA